MLYKIVMAITALLAVIARIETASTSQSTESSPIVPASAQTQSNEAPCGAELKDICGVPLPIAYHEIFDARKCLWANRDSLSDRCSQYLLYQSRSIIEPCYDAILLYCNNVRPGENRIHQCLLQNAKSDVSEQCRDILQEDGVNKIMDEATALRQAQKAEIADQEADTLATSLFDAMVFQEVLHNVAYGGDALKAFTSFVSDLTKQLNHLEALIFKLLKIEESNLEEDEIDPRNFKDGEANSYAAYSAVLSDDDYYHHSGDDDYVDSIKPAADSMMSYAELVDVRMGSLDEQIASDKYSLRGSATVTFPLVNK
jgi:hypothetical protein